MIIEKINIKSFGLLTDTTLEFSDSINVIEGPNEAGKSTIAAFIRYMFYGFDGALSTPELSERARRVNWDSGIAQGSMTVRVKDKRYLISRSTKLTETNPRPVYKEDASVIDLESGAPVFGKMPAGEVFFGVDRELFENTAFVGQIGETKINEGSVKEAIENILFSLSEKTNTEKAAGKLSDKMQQLLHENRMGGAIFELMAKEEELRTRLARFDEDNTEILSKEAELHEIKSIKAEAENKKNSFTELDISYRNFMVIESFDKLHEFEDECERKAEVYNTFIQDNTKNGFVPTSQYLTQIAVARQSVNDAYRHLSDAQERYTKEKSVMGITSEAEREISLTDTFGGEKKIKEDIGKKRLDTVKNSLIASLGGIVTLLMIIFEIIATGFMAEPFMRTTMAILGLGGVGMCAYFIVMAIGCEKAISETAKKFGVMGYNDLKGKLTLIGEKRQKRDTIIAANESAVRALEDAKINYRKSKEELARIVKLWGDEVPETDINAFLDELEMRVDEFLKMKDRLFAEKNDIEITVKEIRRTLLDKSEIDTRAKVPPLKRKVLASVNHSDIISGIAEAKAKIAEQDKLIYEVEDELAALKAKIHNPGLIYSEINSLEKQLAELRMRHKAYYMALDAIKGAEAKLRTEISPRLGEYAAGLMQVMTDKKYSSLTLNDELKVAFLDKSGKDRSADFLSGGTQDLMYIAVRMALIDMLYPEKPPVCFDESFAHQDNVRAKAMMKAIKSLADDGMQSIIFTCRQRECTLASEADKSAAIFRLATDN